MGHGTWGNDACWWLTNTIFMWQPSRGNGNGNGSGNGKGAVLSRRA